MFKVAADVAATSATFTRLVRCLQDLELPVQAALMRRPGKIPLW